MAARRYVVHPDYDDVTDDSDVDDVNPIRKSGTLYSISLTVSECMLDRALNDLSVRVMH